MGLESIIRGGLPETSSIALVGPSGSGKTCLCFQLALEAIQNGQQALYLCTENTPSVFLGHMIGVGFNKMNHSLFEKIGFIDAYSWRLGMKRDEHAIAQVANPGNLSEVNLVITGQSAGLMPGSLVIIDSVSSLSLAAPDESRIRQFIHIISQRLNRDKLSLVLVLEQAAHDKKLIASLPSLVQGNIITRNLEQSDGNLQRQIRVSSMIGVEHETRWFDVVIQDSGIKLVGGIKK